jgi:hypothetical protein
MLNALVPSRHTNELAPQRYTTQAIPRIWLKSEYIRQSQCRLGRYRHGLDCHFLLAITRLIWMREPTYLND